MDGHLRWMYYVSPFTYLVKGFVGLVTHNVPIECADNEFARFSPPPNLTCQEYAQPHIARSGGYVLQQGDMCMLCQYANGDEYVSLEYSVLSFLLLPSLPRNDLHYAFLSFFSTTYSNIPFGLFIQRSHVEI